MPNDASSPGLRTLLAASLVLCCVVSAADTSSESLGERLFHEERFGSPLSDMVGSCATCHPASDGTGFRAFADGLPLSWHPWRYEDPGRFTLRNAPTLLDVGDHELLHHDGEFKSLEEQAEETLVGRNFGWLESERDEAAGTIAAILRDPQTSGGYRESLESAHGVDPTKADDETLIKLAAKSISDFVRTLRSERSSPYDEFIRANGLDDAPRTGEPPDRYGSRIIDEIATLDEAGDLRFVEGFNEPERRGLEMFLRTEGSSARGNCVVCHTPPSFTDRNFHNTAVAQMTYEAVHGTRSFNTLEIPVQTRRPHPNYRAPVHPMKPESVDLGYWNFARYEDSPLLRPQESEMEYLQRTIGTFKTPTLRNLASTAPYMHNGRYPTLVDALDQKIQAAFLARMRDLRNPDPELANIRFYVDDIPDLFAFLNALNDADTRVAEFPGLPTNDGTVAPNSSYYAGSN